MPEARQRENLNLVMLDGEVHNTAIFDSFAVKKVKFDLRWTPGPTHDQEQPAFMDIPCQAWGSVAESLIPVREGTYIRIWGNLNKFVVTNIAGTVSIMDVKVIKWMPHDTDYLREKEDVWATKASAQEE